jgi:glycosyltransferase involved in cell wall biosynthesis
MDPKAGGPTAAVRALVEFAPPGYTCEVVTLDDPAAPFLKLLPFPVHALGPARTGLGYSPRLLGWLRENRNRFDGAMVNGLWQFIGFATWRAFAGHVPYAVFSHGMLDPYFKKAFPLKHLKKWAYWVLADYWVLRGAYRVLFTTEEESRLAEQSFWLHRWHGLVIPFGADRPPSGPAPLIASYLAAFPDMRDRRFLLYLGRIHRKKGCDMLIHSFVKFAPLDPELHLVMAGPDQQAWSDELKQIVAAAGLSHRVHWPGMLTGDIKWGSFYASEAFILPSHQENFGIAVAEAMACGRPVLLADKVNIAPEIAADGAGLMESDTPEGTDNLLRRWIEMTPAQRHRMGQTASQTFDRRYDMLKNAEAINRVFETAPHRS